LLILLKMWNLSRVFICLPLIAKFKILTALSVGPDELSVSRIRYASYLGDLELKSQLGGQLY
jgi:hypothetical protein